MLELCPNLVEINGAVTMGNFTKKIEAKYLVRARVKASEADTISWILYNTPHLEHFEVNIVT